MKTMKTRKLELERGGKKAHHFSSSFLFFPSLSQLKNKMLRPVATVLLLSLLALAAGASATEDLSSGDAPPIGAVLIARKVCFLFSQPSFDLSCESPLKKKSANRKYSPPISLISLFTPIDNSLSSPFPRLLGGTRQ